MTADERDEREKQIQRATAKSAEQSAAGNLPILIDWRDHADTAFSSWSVMSRTPAKDGSPPTHYDVSAVEHSSGVIETRCTCDAAQAGRLCWHRAHCRRALLGEIGYTDARRGVQQTAQPAETTASASDADPFSDLTLPFDD